ncbi:heterocyst frequency control protein PatD [Halomicronema sp. CCY15110]|uniref:heterocyst frequency control protein PatD n=1 Tax=Halomicronema sp. CCY15110 TaxID=2767773 RepID=UPI0019513806|nr:heterocyst frequency control protein PatD [Halomicronema sp. CCY15110]
MTDTTNAETTAIELLAQFVEQLIGLQNSAQAAQVNGRSLQQQFLQAQQLYQTQLLPTLMASPTAEKFMSYQTEINRALRLLGMDVAFLQSAKNSVTLQKRQAQMQQQLQTLLAFCQGLQAAMAES